VADVATRSGPAAGERKFEQLLAGYARKTLALVREFQNAVVRDWWSARCRRGRPERRERAGSGEWRPTRLAAATFEERSNHPDRVFFPSVPFRPITPHDGSRGVLRFRNGILADVTLNADPA